MARTREREEKRMFADPDIDPINTKVEWSLEKDFNVGNQSFPPEREKPAKYAVSITSDGSDDGGKEENSDNPFCDLTFLKYAPADEDSAIALLADDEEMDAATVLLEHAKADSGASMSTEQQKSFTVFKCSDYRLEKSSLEKFDASLGKHGIDDIKHESGMVPFPIEDALCATNWDTPNTLLRSFGQSSLDDISVRDGLTIPRIGDPRSVRALHKIVKHKSEVRLHYKMKKIKKREKRKGRRQTAGQERSATVGGEQPGEEETSESDFSTLGLGDGGIEEVLQHVVEDASLREHDEVRDKPSEYKALSKKAVKNISHHHNNNDDKTVSRRPQRVTNDGSDPPVKHTKQKKTPAPKKASDVVGGPATLNLDKSEGKKRKKDPKKDKNGPGKEVQKKKKIEVIEILSDSRESDTVVLDEDDLIVIDEVEDVEIVTKKPSRAWRLVKIEKRPSSTRKALFAHFKLPPHNGMRRKPTKFIEALVPRIPLEPMWQMPVPPVASTSRVGNATKRPAEARAKRLQMSERLGVSEDFSKRRTYDAVRGLTMEDQWEFNKRPGITKIEMDLRAAGVIKDYGVLPREQYQFPFDPYEGLSWPIFQPFDDVKLDDRDEIDAADVKNQFTDLTVCNFVFKQQLLCDADPGGWQKRFRQASKMTDAQRAANGRFANRVGFARKINNQSTEEARESDQRKQKEHVELIKQLEEMEQEAHAEANQDRLKATEARIKSMRIKDHVRENIIDEYSSNECRCGNRKENKLPKYWFKVPRELYVPANDRRNFLCVLVNHYNKDVESFLANLTRGGSVRPYVPAMVHEVVKPMLEAIYCHQRKAMHQWRMLEADKNHTKNRLKFLSHNLPGGSKVRLDDVREYAKLRCWEFKYWTFIWDCLASIYKGIPPVSLLIKEIEEPVDTAFKRLAHPGHRRAYHNIYRDHKENYLRSKRGY